MITARLGDVSNEDVWNMLNVTKSNSKFFSFFGFAFNIERKIENWVGAHYESLFCLLHSRLSVPFAATIYFNPMNNCSNKYEIHLFSVSTFLARLRISSFFSGWKIQSIACDLRQREGKDSYPPRSDGMCRFHLTARSCSVRELSNVIIVECKSRSDILRRPHKLFCQQSFIARKM